MNFEEWEPHYLQILDYFGFSREDDEKAARVLAGLLTRDDLPRLSTLCRGAEITVCGNAPTLKHELASVRGTVFAADAASEVLLDHGIRPAAVFTDLDGATDRYLEMNREGTVMVVHAHGDNIPLLRHWVPRFPGPLVGLRCGCPRCIGDLSCGVRLRRRLGRPGETGKTLLGTNPPGAPGL
jgi:uncharacterized Rossmann fold enzyme